MELPGGLSQPRAQDQAHGLGSPADAALLLETERHIPCTWGVDCQQERTAFYVDLKSILACGNSILQLGLSLQLIQWREQLWRIGWVAWRMRTAH